MGNELFDQLHQSMKEAVAIAKGEMQPSRVYTVEAPDPWREVAGRRGSVPASVLRGCRSKSEMTHARLSELTGIPQRYISEMEQGKRTIGKENAKKLAKALETDYRMFL